ncbi:NLR family, pyrin domain containing 13 [Seminavis robusta]|uniref:NLR family, pyrin domain containing 13 n=1 Tax=Seminavis robusta TaxID=568900 RepID=A0A9N8ER56_9STRA|nr:NLR family, pyrin domain containing 13 [Seminavis robusta]|eukprot:Sro1653_g288840.1 NLR family, pyrin domain containing 13 (886) ;mRNA; r:12738-15395
MGSASSSNATSQSKDPNIAKAHENVHLLLYRAKAAARRGRLEEAAKLQEQAKEIIQHLLMAGGRVGKDKGDFLEAIKLDEQAKEAIVDHLKLALEAAAERGDQGEAKKLEEQIKAANIELLLSRANAAAMRGDLEEATNWGQKVKQELSKACPHSKRLLDSATGEDFYLIMARAMAAEMKGDHREATKLVEEAEQANVPLLMTRAAAAARRGDEKEAMNLDQQAKAIIAKRNQAKQYATDVWLKGNRLFVGRSSASLKKSKEEIEKEEEERKKELEECNRKLEEKRAAEKVAWEAKPLEERKAIMQEKWAKSKAYHQKQIAQHDANPAKVERSRMVWQAVGAADLEPALQNGAVVLLDVHWLIEYAKYSDGPMFPILPPRQELEKLHPEAFISLDKIRDSTSTDSLNGNRQDAHIHIYALSYSWLHSDHPDPKGVTLRAVANACENRFNIVNHFPPRWGLFWDYACLYQHPQQSEGVYRTPEEDRLFQQGLYALPLLYSHPQTSCLRLTTRPTDYPEDYNLPQGANVAEYMDRGWPFVESCWMSVAKSSGKVLNLFHDEHQRKEATNGKSFMFMPPPLTPEKMKDRLLQKSFTNAKSDYPRVSDLYSRSFGFILGRLRKLDYAGFKWDAQMVTEVADIIGKGFTPQMEILNLNGNQLGTEGCSALADAFCGPFTPQVLRHVTLSGVKLNLEACQALSRGLAALFALRILELPETDLGDEGVQAMAPVLVRMRFLDLSKCNLGVPACRALADAAAQDSVQWTHLRLENNKAIGNEGFSILSPALQKANLTCLSTFSTSLDLDGLDKLVTTLIDRHDQTPPRLTRVKLAWSEFEITDKLHNILLKLVKASPNLCTLELGMPNRLEGFAEFRDALQQNAQNKGFRLLN